MGAAPFSGINTHHTRTMELPAGVHPVTSNTPHNQERLAKEVRIIRAPEASSYRWGREQFFTRKTTAQSFGRLLLAYSVDSAGRIIRGWYLTSLDQSPYGWYRKPGSGCPCEAAWLGTIMPGRPSEPAILYMAWHR
jgi:hypothetical protein